MAVWKNCSYYFAELLQQSSNILFLLLFIIEKFERHKGKKNLITLKIFRGTKLYYFYVQLK